MGDCRRGTDAVGRIVGIKFVISPPTGVLPDTDWIRYMHEAFVFLLPVKLTVDEFIVTLTVESSLYVGGTAILEHEIV